MMIKMGLGVILALASSAQAWAGCNGTSASLSASPAGLTPTALSSLNSSSAVVTTAGTTPPPAPSGGTGWQGSLSVYSENEPNPGGNNAVTRHLAGTYSNNVSSTRATFPLSFDFQFQPGAQPMLNEIQIQGFSSTQNLANNYTLSSPGLYLYADLGHGGGSRIYAPLVSATRSFDVQRGAAGGFVNLTLNGPGPRYDQSETDGSTRWSAQLAYAAVQEGVHVSAGRSSFVCTNQNGWSWSEAPAGSGHSGGLVREQDGEFRCTWRMPDQVSSISAERDYQHYQSVGSSSGVLLEYTRLVGNH